MRKLTVLLSLFVLTLSPAIVPTQANVASTSGSSISAIPNQTDERVIRLAADFGVLQNSLEEIVMYQGVSEATKIRLKLLEKTFREQVMRIVVAARDGDGETVHRYLPSTARSIRKQILALTSGEDVSREWAAARTKAYESITTTARLTTEHWSIVVARIESGGARIQNA